MTVQMQSRGELMAAVDLGSNSFRLLIAKEDGGQIVPFSMYHEGVRLAGGLSDSNEVAQEKLAEACSALERFRERLGAIAPGRVRAVATSTYRVAKNRAELLCASEAALGYKIDVISGQEEARLIYLGCAHTLPWSDQERLIVDIGGGSTECIIGQRYEPSLTESFPLGAVTLSQNFFPGATVTAVAGATAVAVTAAVVAATAAAVAPAAVRAARVAAQAVAEAARPAAVADANPSEPRPAGRPAGPRPTRLC